VKLPPLAYHRAESVEHAIALLRQYQGEAKIIAGGQSLIPMLAYRLATPAALIDIGRLADLATIRLDDRGLSIGSLTRWCDIQCSAEIRKNHPLLHDAIGHVAHYQIRNRGTIGGSLAHCDPAAECPAVVLACHGEIIVQGSNGARSVRAEEFFQGLFSTDLQDDEVITAIKLPPWNSKRLWAFSEFSRRTGDFALAGVAMHFEMVGDCISVPSIVGFGVGDRALILRATQDALEFNAPEPEIIARAVNIAREEIDPPVDAHAPPDYRRALFGVLLERALKEALGRNRGLMS
jgi:aerobic carbon-monoxide dehydrogenase medium subunit